MVSNVWCITGAGRGLGIDIARSALAAGHYVVATGRDAARVENAIGAHENLFAVALDIMGEITSDLSVFRDMPDDVVWEIALAE